MINPENEVFTILATALRERFPGISVADDPEAVPANFPHVSIEMSNNTTFARYMNSGNYEVAIVVFSINVYSNLKTGRKRECRQIADFIDGLLTPKNFRRQAVLPIRTHAHPEIYRLAMTYRVATDGKFFYRR
jgi:hypothetical protein